jgi:iron-regulated transporter 1
MVTYLLSAGYSATQVGVARTLSVAFEVLATWVAPWLMSKIGPVRAGLWLSSWQVTMLVAGIIVFWVFVDKPIISASGLVGGTILSRVGLRGFDLCAQLIVQEVEFIQTSAKKGRAVLTICTGC